MNVCPPMDYEQPVKLPLVESEKDDNDSARCGETIARFLVKT